MKNSMSHDEIRENLEWFIETYGIEELCLSGGEPTVHPSFAENIRLSREKGLCLYLHTNGISFGKAHFASRHAPFISRVLVGLSCHNEASCGELTGIGKSFHARLDGIVNLQNQNVPLRTNCVVLRQNYKNLPDIGKLLLSLNVKKALFTLPFFFERCDEHVKAFVPPDLSEVTPYLQETLESLTGAGRFVFVQGLPPCRLAPSNPMPKSIPTGPLLITTTRKKIMDFCSPACWDISRMMDAGRASTERSAGASRHPERLDQHSRSFYDHCCRPAVC